MWNYRYARHKKRLTFRNLMFNQWSHVKLSRPRARDNFTQRRLPIKAMEQASAPPPKKNNDCLFLFPRVSHFPFLQFPSIPSLLNPPLPIILFSLPFQTSSFPSISSIPLSFLFLMGGQDITPGKISEVAVACRQVFGAIWMEKNRFFDESHFLINWQFDTQQQLPINYDSLRRLRYDLLTVRKIIHHYTNDQYNLPPFSAKSLPPIFFHGAFTPRFMLR